MGVSLSPALARERVPGTGLVLEGGKVAQSEMLLNVSPLWQPY